MTTTPSKMPDSTPDRSSAAAAAPAPETPKIGYIKPLGYVMEEDSDDEWDSVEDNECEDDRVYANIERVGFPYPICIGDVIETRTQGANEIHEQYRIVHRLGHGSSSIVWLAHETKHGKTFALKIMSTGGGKGSRKRDYRMQKAIKESSIGKTHLLLYKDTFTLQEPTQAHLALVLPPAGPHLQILGHKRSIKCRMSAAKQLLEALRSLHQAGIVHGGKFRVAGSLLSITVL